MNKLIKILLTIIACIIQISFLPTFESLSYLNLILCIAILLLFYQSNFLLYFVIISGIILDIYSILPFSIITIGLIATIFLLNLLFKNLFTNRSLYSLLLLGLIGTITYNLISNILIYLTYLLKLTEYYPEINKLFFLNLTYQIIANLVFLSLIWFLSNLFKHKLQKTFFLKT